MNRRTVFLDTNILIDGSRRPEHHALKELERSRRVKLVASYENRAEQLARSRELRERNHIFWSLYEANKNPSTRELLQQALEVEDRLKASEQAEQDFWREVDLSKPPSTLDAVYDLEILGHSIAKMADEKGELRLAAELVDHHGIRMKDAMLLMQAHSIEADTFLTWDDKLIKKAIKVGWLKPKVMTPAAFLRKLGSVDIQA